MELSSVVTKPTGAPGAQPGRFAESFDVSSTSARRKKSEHTDWCKRESDNVSKGLLHRHARGPRRAGPRNAGHVRPSSFAARRPGGIRPAPRPRRVKRAAPRMPCATVAEAVAASLSFSVSAASCARWTRTSGR